MFAKIMSNLLVGMLFFFCLSSIPAFSQSSWTYADTWLDTETGFDETKENNDLYVMGSGVAEIDTSSLAHAANMQVEVRSPQGRAEYELGTWSQQSSGTSITVVVSLIVVWQPTADAGNYTTNTTVQVTCPLEPGMSYGSASIPVGISVVALRRESWSAIPPFARFRRIIPCDAYCSSSINTYSTGRPNEIILECLHFTYAFSEVAGIPICLRLNNLPIPAVYCTCFDVSNN